MLGELADRRIVELFADQPQQVLVAESREPHAGGQGVLAENPLAVAECHGRGRLPFGLAVQRDVQGHSRLRGRYQNTSHSGDTEA